MTTELARLQNFGPNWFASVMGTGIVATAGVTLPVHVPGLRGFSHVVWVVAALLLVVLIVAVTVQWARHPTVARSHVRNPQMSHFYGAAPMALMTVGAGALLIGKDLIGDADRGRPGLGVCGQRAPWADCSPRRRSRT